MKITRRQLRQLIKETMHRVKRPRNPIDHLDPELVDDKLRSNLQSLIDDPDLDTQRQGYDLATELQQDELVFPIDGESYLEKPYSGSDYIADREEYENIFYLIEMFPTPSHASSKGQEFRSKKHKKIVKIKIPKSIVQNIIEKHQAFKAVNYSKSNGTIAREYIQAIHSVWDIVFDYVDTHHPHYIEGNFLYATGKNSNLVKQFNEATNNEFAKKYFMNSW